MGYIAKMRASVICFPPAGCQVFFRGCSMRYSELRNLNLAITQFVSLDLIRGRSTVVNIIYVDEAHQFRIEIEGRLSGSSVSEVHDRWREELVETSPRKFVVDISDLTGCDEPGFRLLHEMHSHGTYIAARNPRALDFLNKISSPEANGPTLVYKAEGEVKRKSDGKASVTRFPLRKAAGAGG